MWVEFSTPLREIEGLGLPIVDYIYLDANIFKMTLSFDNYSKFYLGLSIIYLFIYIFFIYKSFDAFFFLHQE